MIESAETRAVVRANHLQVDQQRKEDLRRKILAMIPSVDHTMKHAKMRDLRYAGTGAWMLQDDRYLDWERTESPAYLCCYGIPGSGKSVIASGVIDHLTNNTSHIEKKVVHYYCDYGDQRTLQTDRILGTILKQLLPTNRIPKEMEAELSESCQDDSRPLLGTNSLLSLICSIVQLNHWVSIIFDGLDECDSAARQDILALLDRLKNLRKTTVKMLITCREEDQILRSLRGFSLIHVTATSVQSDIECFVAGSVKLRMDSGQLKLRAMGLEQEIVSELVGKAHGM